MWTVLKGEIYSRTTKLQKINKRSCQNLFSQVFNILCSFRWQLVDVISDKLADCPEEQEKWRKSVATAAIKCLIASYSHSKDQATSPLQQEHSILKRLQRVLVGLLYAYIL